MLRRSIGLSAVVFIGVLLLAMGAGAASQEPGRLHVSAQVELQVEPDMAVFSAGTETRADTLEEAREKNARAMADVQAQLLAAGVKESEVKTRGYQAHPEWHHDKTDGSRTLVGYRVNHTIEVTVRDLDQLGAWIDTAIAAGATQISGPVFGLTNAEALEIKAIEEAVRKARVKADALAAASGTFLRRVVSISENVYTPFGNQLSVARQSAMMAMDQAAPTPTSISPGQITINASVSITFEI